MRTYPKLAGTALAATLVGGAATALAAPIALPTGPIFGKYLGVEQVAPGNNTVGVGSPFPATSGTTGADCAGCVNENLTTDKEGTFGVFVIDTCKPGRSSPRTKISHKAAFLSLSTGRTAATKLPVSFTGRTSRA